MRTLKLIVAVAVFIAAVALGRSTRLAFIRAMTPPSVYQTCGFAGPYCVVNGKWEKVW
jgi:hypothetical protein